MFRNWRRALTPALVLAILMLPAISMAQIGFSVSVNVPPPELPVYEQPAIPGDGYLWTPGYWSWDQDYGDYFWVPGTWVQAPEPGLLWTPGYWGTEGGAFLFHAGYWGPHVGFYGGVNYGFGYVGEGFEGGYWQGDHLYYNRSVTNVGTTNITNVYNKTVINNTTVNRVSYNGGNGVQARPTPAQITAQNERHVPPVAAQQQHVQAARTDPQMRASANHGKPAVAATAKPGAIPGHEQGAAQHSAPATTAPRPGAVNERPAAAEHPAQSHAPSGPAAAPAHTAAPMTNERSTPRESHPTPPPPAEQNRTPPRETRPTPPPAAEQNRTPPRETRPTPPTASEHAPVRPAPTEARPAPPMASEHAPARPAPTESHAAPPEHRAPEPAPPPARTQARPAEHAPERQNGHEPPP